MSFAGPPPRPQTVPIDHEHVRNVQIGYNELKPDEPASEYAGWWAWYNGSDDAGMGEKRFYSADSDAVMTWARQFGVQIKVQVWAGSAIVVYP